jgi:sulfur-carrier protein
VLDDLTSRFPDLEGQLRYANVYVDGEDIRTLDELETPVRDGATIILLPAMAGGV